MLRAVPYAYHLPNCPHKPSLSTVEASLILAEKYANTVLMPYNLLEMLQYGVFSRLLCADAC